LSNYVEIKGYRIDSRDSKSVKQSKELDYLLPKKGTQESLDALQDAVDEDNAKDSPERNCYKKANQYTGYDDPRNLFEVPSDFEARIMCAGCPLLELCDSYASKAHPFGVWGGKRYGDSLLTNDE